MNRTPRDVDTLIEGLLANAVTSAHLRQDAPHFAGLSTADAERLRAHLLASFEAHGIPDDAHDVVAEDLRTSASPAVLAGAARAVRGEDGHKWTELLQNAADRIAAADVYVRWQPGVIEPTWMRTARDELLAVIEERRERREDPSGTTHEVHPIGLNEFTIRGVEVEDQLGTAMRLGELLGGRATVLAFFYTRCMNPNRCSLTVTRLAALARSKENHRSVLAMTYDPAYDTPERMHRYGSDRDFPFGEQARIVRATQGWSDVRETFGLRVGYGPITVNDHAREVFLIGPDLVATPIHPDVLAVPLPNATGHR